MDTLTCCLFVCSFFTSSEDVHVFYVGASLDLITFSCCLVEEGTGCFALYVCLYLCVYILTSLTLGVMDCAVACYCSISWSCSLEFRCLSGLVCRWGYFVVVFMQFVCRLCTYFVMVCICRILLIFKLILSSLHHCELCQFETQYYQSA